MLNPCNYLAYVIIRVLWAFRVIKLAKLLTKRSLIDCQISPLKHITIPT